MLNSKALVMWMSNELLILLGVQQAGPPEGENPCTMRKGSLHCFALQTWEYVTC